MAKSAHITANFSASVQGAPSEIVYLPEGTHEISATVNGEPGSATVIVAAGIEKVFQSDLEQRLAANVRPFLDFDHEEGKASAIPTAFKYVEGKGLILELDWSSSGKEAIEGRDYSYFSPSFLLSGETPTGLRDSGAIGGLVNDPAFRTISKIAASHAATKPKEPKTPPYMSDLITAGILNESEAAKDDAVSVAAKRYASYKADAEKVDAARKETEAAKAKLVTVEASLKEANEALEDQKKAAAEAAVQVAVEAGQIPPKDEDTKKFWVEAMLSNPEGSKKALAALPKKDVSGKVVNGSTGDGGSDTSLIDAANKARSEGKNVGDAISAASRMTPAAYAEYRAQFSN